MDKYQTFNRNRLYIILQSDEKVQVPDYVSKSLKRFKYDSDENTIEKQCSKCGVWYKVAKYDKSEWSDIHDEAEIHLMNSGYSSYCHKCEPKVPEKKGKDETHDDITTSAQEKYSVFMTEKHKKYLKMRSALEDKPMKQILCEIFDREIKENPIGKFLEE